jgi:hypothetical protein
VPVLRTRSARTPVHHRPKPEVGRCRLLPVPRATPRPWRPAVAAPKRHHGGHAGRCAGCSTSADRCTGIAWAEARVTPPQESAEPSGGGHGAGARLVGAEAPASPLTRNAPPVVLPLRPEGRHAPGRSPARAWRYWPAGRRAAPHARQRRSGAEAQEAPSGGIRCQSSDLRRLHRGVHHAEARGTSTSSDTGVLRRRSVRSVGGFCPKAVPAGRAVRSAGCTTTRRSAGCPGASRGSHRDTGRTTEPVRRHGSGRTVAGVGAEAPAFDGGATAPVAHLGQLAATVPADRSPPERRLQPHRTLGRRGGPPSVALAVPEGTVSLTSGVTVSDQDTTGAQGTTADLGPRRRTWSSGGPSSDAPVLPPLRQPRLLAGRPDRVRWSESTSHGLSGSANPRATPPLHPSPGGTEVLSGGGCIGGPGR